MNRAKSFDADGREKPLSLAKDSISSIMNSDSFKKVRTQMLGGFQPAACHRCYSEEARGLTSKRRAENKVYSSFTKEAAKKVTAEDGTIDPNFRFVELRLGNLCNLKCRSCNPASSHKWAEEYGRISTELPFVRSFQGMSGFEWIQREEVWEELLQKSGSLEVLYINGGEPTLIERHWRWLSELVERGRAKDISLWYNINLTYLPESAFAIWQKFKDVRIYCSIDDLEARNEVLRSGSRWPTILANLDRLRAEKWIDVAVNQTISWMNAFYLDEFYSFMNARNLTVHFNMVYDPDYLSPWILPEAIKSDIVDRCAKIMRHWETKFIRGHLLENSSNPELLRKGLEFNGWLDRSRNENSTAVFSQLFMALNKES